MKQLKRIFGNYGYIDVEIDTDLATDAVLHEMNDFWANGEEKLKETGGDVLTAVLRRLYEAAAYAHILKDIHTAGDMIEHFNEKEGWYPLDGSYGIRITDVALCMDEPECDEMMDIRPGE
jgi:hypothetical protein